MLQPWSNRAKDAWPEQHSGEQLAHDRGLANPLHRLAEEAPTDKERDDLGKEHHLGGSVLTSLGDQRGWQHDEKKCQSEASAPPPSNQSAAATGGAFDFVPPIGHQARHFVMGPLG
jgi:hypothetical protein